MTEPATSKAQRIIVIGSGIAGLAAAHKLTHNQHLKKPEILVLESANRAGGVINTLLQDNCILVCGPDSFLTEKPEALEFCQELGLQDQIIGTNPSSRRSFIAYKNKLFPLPKGFSLLAPGQLTPFFFSPLLSFQGKLRVMADLFLPKRNSQEDESLAQFTRRRFGQEVLERIAQPMVAGIYTANPEQLSLQACLPRFFHLEEEYSSIIKGLKHTSPSDAGARYSLFATLKHGLGTLIETATKHLPDNCLHYQSPVSTIERNFPESAFKVILATGKSFSADAVIICTAAYTAGQILAQVDPELSVLMKQIPYASSAVLNFIFNRVDIPHALDGFGFVVPVIEQRHILACSFLSIKFPHVCPKDKVILRVFAGGALQEDIYNASDEEIKAWCQQDLCTYLGITKVPVLSLLTRHPHSMPQYQIGHLNLMAKIQKKLSDLPGLFLAGNAYEGVGIPDCVASGKKAALQAIDTLKLS